jgi:hypothetical protein
MFTSEEPANSLLWLDNDLRVAALDPFRSIRCDVKSSNRNIRIAFRRKFDIVRRLFTPVFHNPTVTGEPRLVYSKNRFYM